MGRCSRPAQAAPARHERRTSQCPPRRNKHLRQGFQPTWLSLLGNQEGKSAIHLVWVYRGRKRNFVGHHFWARGYFVSTMGGDEATVRDYIRQQEQEDKRLDQLDLWH